MRRYSGDKTTSPEEIIQKTAEILRKYFPNGLAINDAKQFNKFRDYLEDAIGDEADRFFTSKVIEFLEKAGVRVENLVLPQKSDENNDVPQNDSSKNTTSVKDEKTARRVIGSTLLRFFAKDGYKLKSAEDARKLRVLAGAEFEKLTDEKLDDIVAGLIRPFNGVCYPINKRTIDRIKETSEEIFRNGCKIIYYSALFDKNKDWLVACGIFNASFLCDRTRVFFTNYSHYTRYFEKTPSELTEIEKVREEITRVWATNEEFEKSVEELVDATFVTAEKLEETLEFYPEFKKFGKKWRFKQEDELEADADVLLIDPFDYLPLGVATREEEERQEDVLQVYDDCEETQETDENASEKEASKPEIETSNRAFKLKFPLAVDELNFAKPVSCFYRKEEIAKKCDWSELYADVIAKLFAEYAPVMKSKLNQSLGAGRKPDFADKKNKKNLRTPARISSDFYVETHGSAYQIANKIKLAFELCGAALDDLEVWVQKRETIKGERKKELEEERKDGNDAKTPEERAELDAYVPMEGDVRLNFSESKGKIAHTNPVLCRYRGETLVGKCNWTKLYVVVLTRLFEERPQRMRSKLNQSLGAQDKPDFIDDLANYPFIRPIKIADGFYVEANYSAYGLANRLRSALELCEIDPDELEVWYRKKRLIRATQEKNDEESVEPTSFRDVENMELIDEDALDEDFFENAPELCRYQNDEEDLDWLYIS